MELLGAKVVPVASGTRTLKDATNEAIRDWVTNVRTTFYILGSVVGPHPYPRMVRDFQSVIGQEIRAQLLEKEGREVPDAVVACVGGGSNAIGAFAPFAYAEPRPRLIGVEAAASTAFSPTGAWPSTLPSPTRRPSLAFASSPEPRGLSRRWSRRTRWPTPPRWCPRCRGRRWW